MTFALWAACVVVAAALLLSPAILRRWYLYEARRLDIPENPEDRIITYPLA
jgi:hypothetical protein